MVASLASGWEFSVGAPKGKASALTVSVEQVTSEQDKIEEAPTKQAEQGVDSDLFDLGFHTSFYIGRKKSLET